MAFGAALVAVPITVSTFHPVVFAAVFQIDFRLFHLILIAVVLIVVATVLTTTVRHEGRRSPLAWAFAVVVGLLVVVLPQVDDTDNDFDGSTVSWLASSFDDSEVLFFLYNGLTFALAVGAIIAGQRWSIRGLVNLGFAMVSVLFAALYIGRIAGALPTSLAVILGGLGLVGGAIYLERKRRDVTGSVTSEMAADLDPVEEAR